MPVCPNCSTDNPVGFKFCGSCGKALGRTCPNCSAEVPEGFKFCGECGTAINGTAAPAAPAVTSAAAPVAERRFVSVLFADLVSFTTFSEARDAEEVREMLSRYFETCRRLVGLYGGTIEKFIGDAVMAVWGAPIAQEDDAERAVRTALELTDAVAALGVEIGAPELRARAGVLTGEAAVTVGAEAEGMVAGDLVNTASRIQSAAAPGQVFVGEATRRATEASIVYEDAGEHTLKGKAEPMRLWHAARVISGIGGAQRTTGLEAPFVGRERELRLIKDLFHESVEENRAHLASITGIGGIGKSRLMWEFFKYIDGVATQFRWHRGRCLSYGEGVTYWALAEMVRTRAGIVEAEDQQSALAKLRTALEESIPDQEERRYIEPRLAHLLGLEERVAREREDLFAAWRLFYERLAEQMPTIMVFEDVQWADASMLDFIEHILEWSRNHRIFILTLGRPEISAKRPEWGGGKRGMTTVYLEPLSHQAMVDLMDQFVPGLPEDTRDRILARAEGVPLYAVETVRMLLDRGLLVREGSIYRLTGSIETLEVPESMHALIAARLDGLPSDERQLVRDGAVLGKTFTRAALAAVAGFSEQDLDPLLASLTRKEVLHVQADVRSPDRGQYGFVQDVVRQVAYDTLSKKDRKTLHLAAARYLVERWGEDEDEIVEVVASHYLDAYHAAPSAEDADEIKRLACNMLERAARRAASLAASGEAQRYYEQAADLTSEALKQADLLDQAGRMAYLGGRAGEALSLLKRATDLFRSSGQEHSAALVEASIAEVYWADGHVADAMALLEASFATLKDEEPDEALATVAAQLGRFRALTGDMEGAQPPLEMALEMAETLGFPNVFANALTSRGLLLMWRGRYQEAELVHRHALDVALANDLFGITAKRALANLGVLFEILDRYEELITLTATGLDVARRIGDGDGEMMSLTSINVGLFFLGRWDEAIQRAVEARQNVTQGVSEFSAMGAAELAYIYVGRGDLDAARAEIEPFLHLETAEDLQRRGLILAIKAALLSAEGRYEEAIRAAEASVKVVGEGAYAGQQKMALTVALEAATALRDPGRVEELLLTHIEQLRPGDLTPYLRVLGARFAAHLATMRGEADTQDAAFTSAQALCRQRAIVYPLAVILTEHAEWLIEAGRRAEAATLLTEASEIFDRLQARPGIERVKRALERAGEEVHA